MNAKGNYSNPSTILGIIHNTRREENQPYVLKIASLMLLILIIIGFTACGRSVRSATTTTTAAAATTTVAATTTAAAATTIAATTFPTSGSEDTIILTSTESTTASQTSETSNERTLESFSGKFSIEGKWKQTGDNTFGQAQKGAIIVFDGTRCNWYSPADTYAFYKEGKNYRLDTTNVLFGDTPSFIVVAIDNDNIDVYNGTNAVSLMRVQ